MSSLDPYVALRAPLDDGKWGEMKDPAWDLRESCQKLLRNFDWYFYLNIQRNAELENQTMLKNQRL